MHMAFSSCFRWVIPDLRGRLLADCFPSFKTRFQSTTVVWFCFESCFLLKGIIQSFEKQSIQCYETCASGND